MGRGRRICSLSGPRGLDTTSGYPAPQHVWAVPAESDVRMRTLLKSGHSQQFKLFIWQRFLLSGTQNSGSCYNCLSAAYTL